MQELAGPWTVRSGSQWGWPESVVFEKLDDWSKRQEEGIKFFSGTASYQESFDLPEPLRQGGRRIYLDLGNVRNVAEVRLNGTNLGVVWTVPFRLDITHVVKPAGNMLEIAVTNLWWNRLVGDAGLPENKRLTKTNVRLDKNSPLLESGLLGPVTLQATAPDSGTLP
ncbi:MAG: glycosylhydrolase-like jelly roll fold domain-containing protein [Pirellulaceae bacterium]